MLGILSYDVPTLIINDKESYKPIIFLTCTQRFTGVSLAGLCLLKYKILRNQ